MRRLIALAIALAVVAGIGAAARPATDYRLANRQSPLYHIAVIGDSYTNGTDIGGVGPKGWTVQAFDALANQGVQISPDVAAEGRAGYGVRGDHGSLFVDLTGRVVHPDDNLVVFFGSRNDQGVDPTVLAGMAHDAFALARQLAPSANLLVVGPPWPTPDAPPDILQIRDVLKSQAQWAGASFFDPLAAGWFAGRPDLIGPDGVHPTDAGHIYMAQRLVPLISSQLPRRT
ncbi:Rv0518 family GDSL lipase [Mycolicibacterium komossense]|uniref:SGNH/GDSL hydrolase family protein n=1 Tax=Mycolicibacterium komossense TaxID=1779 RepID=A0ABT3CAN8_9MYCO|nr:GDSL lipase [Mycolicibacterium komossense]MCV7226538.1 SGNH/GDSL hydrolase family protein [Mycolicibacterium komossense]